jgi:ubiquitin carboxyl-terminal hydrolase 8
MDSNSNKGQIGLPNVGNSCYLNSTIQCLVGTKELLKYFSQTSTLSDGKEVRKYQLDLIAQKTVKKNKTETKQNLVKAWYNLMSQLWSDKSHQNSINPIPFYRLIGQVAKESKASISINGDQNDFQEFLILLLDSLHDGLSKETTMNIVGKDMNRMDAMARKAYENFIRHFEKDYSIFIKLFNGQINTLTIGECGHQSNIFDPIKFFQLTVPASFQPINLEDLLTQYVSQNDLVIRKLEDGTEIDERWYCGECKTKVSGVTCNTIWDLPQYLIISLGRYQYFPRLAKINTPVIFPLQNLDMSKFFSGFKKNSLKYNLYAVANHFGNPSGGHYTAYRKNPNNKWYSFNDGMVEEITELERTIITNGAYCLFYERND